ncbi:hypothetical protein TUM19329_10030 [Legionella antarctica]|uniref:Mutator family transposase n=1 Tax=Legionella antarctica TaxID=2708020 RepID=A0A6F8T3P3_9GAMM|nr:hypothetical protein TUM19329_10030 [Legionella antarctica]
MNNKEIDLEHFDFSQFQAEAIEQLKLGQSLTGKGGILTPLIKKILEAALEGEMDSHLSDCKSDNLLNRRNGKLTKTIKTDTGSFELSTPRDRDSSFEPEIVKKRQTVPSYSRNNRVND